MYSRRCLSDGLLAQETRWQQDAINKGAAQTMMWAIKNRSKYDRTCLKADETPIIDIGADAKVNANTNANDEQNCGE